VTEADCEEGCDAAEFEALVQRNLGADAGFDFADFADMLTRIARRNLATLRRLERGASSGTTVTVISELQDTEATCPEHKSGPDTDPDTLLSSQRLHLAFNLQRAGRALAQLCAYVEARAAKVAAAAAPQQRRPAAGAWNAQMFGLGGRSPPGRSACPDCATDESNVRMVWPWLSDCQALLDELDDVLHDMGFMLEPQVQACNRELRL
jgi:hypothetical protein